MKISCGLRGTFKMVLVGILAVLLLLPSSVFPQQKTQAIDTLSIRKTKNLFPVLADTTGQDSTWQVRNISNQDTILNIIPTIKPDYSNFTLIIQINDGQQYSQSKEVNLSFIAPQAIDMMVANKSDWSDGQWEPFQAFKRWSLIGEDGNQTVYFRVRYPDSSLSRIVSDNIILSITPPVAKFQVRPDSGIAGETWFSFDASESHHHSNIFLRWDWDGDGQSDTEWSRNKEATYQYRFGGGRREVKLEVKDDSGWNVAYTQPVVVYSRPYPDFIYTQNFYDPLEITFDAANSGDYEDGNNLQYRWNFQADSLWDSDWSFDKICVRKFEPFAAMEVMLEAKDAQGLTNRITAKVMNRYDEMVFVPAGDFIMGHDEYEIDERPTHAVYLSAFWIDKFPVTNKKYVQFLNEYVRKYPDKTSEIGRFIHLDNAESRIKFEYDEYVVIPPYDDHPVVNITWHGADAYCRFYDKRLPTEAEWEKAARGTDQRLYPWGETIDSSRANYWDSGDPFDNGTTPVGFYSGRNVNGFLTQDSPSFFGAYDMAGNVKEWVADWYLRNYYSQSPKIDPTGAVSGSKKVVRGSGFLFHSTDSRATFRYAAPPEKATNFIGFRCVKSLPN